MNELYSSLLSWSRTDESFEHGAINGLGLALQPAGSPQCTVLQGVPKVKCSILCHSWLYRGSPDSPVFAQPGNRTNQGLVLKLQFMNFKVPLFAQFHKKTY